MLMYHDIVMNRYYLSERNLQLSSSDVSLYPQFETALQRRVSSIQKRFIEQEKSLPQFCVASDETSVQKARKPAWPTALSAERKLGRKKTTFLNVKMFNFRDFFSRIFFF